MARKSRKNLAKAVISNIPVTVGYIRLSVFNGDESSSIENQKQIIELWGATEKTPISHFYIDNGSSGTSFKRPAFAKLLQDIEAGKVECVVVKDLSRLGRDLISTGYYIECYFPSKKVRFVSVNDQFDTADGITNHATYSKNGIRIPLTNALNEQFSLDIKKKVSAMLDMKAQHGMFIGPRAPFGYMKDSQCHFRIVPDPEAAHIVKEIFDMATNGMTITAIVRYLNENQIPTPIQYARSKGLEGNYHDGNGSWNSRSVKYILTNRTYTGALVQGKEKRAVEGTHMPLVSTEQFDAIQSALQARAFTLNAKEQSTENFLKGKVTCGCCGGKMQRKRGTNHANWYFYTCITKNRVGTDKCIGMYVREEDIFSAIYHQLKLYLKEHFILASQYKQTVAAFDIEILERRKAYDADLKHSMHCFEKFVEDEITEDEYQPTIVKMRETKALLDEVVQRKEQYEKMHQDLRKMSKIADKELPLDGLAEYIEQILVFEGKNIAVKWC